MIETGGSRLEPLNQQREYSKSPPAAMLQEGFLFLYNYFTQPID
jgi:hypothetical protein